MDAKEIVANALELARIRLGEIPTFPIYVSCVAQLDYLQSVLDGKTPIDRGALRSIIVGHYGIREFEETDPEFSEALKNAQLIASRMADGLKV